jgi:signal transduction histidine kinase
VTCPLPFPDGLASNENMEAVLSSMRDYIGMHQLVLDDNNTIVDTELIWWNKGYEQIRVTPVVPRQKMMATYHEPHVALGFVRDAWSEGQTRQIFELNEDTVDRYRAPETLVRIEVTWLRLGDLVLEIGSDLSEMTSLEIELAIQRQAYIDATRESVLSAERSRIGRDLHDSVIQSLFAISLNLKSGQDCESASHAINEVITNIRSTIFEITPTTRPPVRDSIEEIIGLFRPAWSLPPKVTLHIQRELPDDILADVQNVIRESLSNAARHARAQQVEITVVIDDSHVEICVADDGIGPDGINRRKAGTLSLAHRASTRHGKFDISPGAQGGTVVTWSCPIV